MIPNRLIKLSDPLMMFFLICQINLAIIIIIIIISAILTTPAASTACNCDKSSTPAASTTSRNSCYSLISPTSTFIRQTFRISRGSDMCCLVHTATVERHLHFAQMCCH